MRQPRIHKKNQRGQAIVLIAALMVALIAALGLAIDGGGMFLLYRDVQNATDAAGLSAAFAYCTDGDWEQAAIDSAGLNGFLDTDPNVTITVESPPVSLTDNTDLHTDGYIGVRIQAEKPAYFIQVVYSGPLTIEATTISECSPADNFGLLPDAAIITLRDECTSPMQAGVTGTGANATVVIGSIYSAMPIGCKGFRLSGGADFIVTGQICSDGTIDPGATKNIFGAPAVANSPCLEATNPGTDPLGLAANPPTCDMSVDHGDIGDYADGTGNEPAPAGYYSSMTTSPSENIQLSPGIYCTNSSIDFKGTVTTLPGGVTIYMDCGNCTFDTRATADNVLRASESGDYAGLLLYTTSHNTTNGNKCNGGSGLDVVGTIYAPTSSCSVSGSNDTAIVAQFICWDYHSAGSSEVTIYHEPAAFYRRPPNFGLTQ